MKAFLKSLILVSILGIHFSASAADPTLKQNMKQIAAHLKLLQSTLNDPQQNLPNANECEKMIVFLTTTAEQKPKFIQSLPKEQQPKAFEDYKEMTKQEIERIKELKELLILGDNKAAGVKLDEIIALKNKGHKTFDP